MKVIGERGAGNPPAAFDEGRQEKSRRLLYFHNTWWSVSDESADCTVLCCTPLEPYISGVWTQDGGQEGELERVSEANERLSLAEYAKIK